MFVVVCGFWCPQQLQRLTWKHRHVSAEGGRCLVGRVRPLFLPLTSCYCLLVSRCLSLVEPRKSRKFAVNPTSPNVTFSWSLWGLTLFLIGSSVPRFSVFWDSWKQKEQLPLPIWHRPLFCSKCASQQAMPSSHCDKAQKVSDVIRWCGNQRAGTH